MEEISIIFSKISFICVGLLNGIIGMTTGSDTQKEIVNVKANMNNIMKFNLHNRVFLQKHNEKGTNAY